MMTSYTKDPNAVLDWKVDWTAWLASGETITTSTWIVPTGITKDSDTHTGTAATVWLSGGTVNVSYEVTNRVVTSAGRTDDRTIRINVRQR
jgi:hypothetical protein